LLRSIEVYQGNHVTRLAMKLMSLSFLRTSELIGAEWAEFDFETARWDIPAERMKMRKPHIVPLARQTLEVLEMLRRLTGDSKWLFPGIVARLAGRYAVLPSSLMAICVQMYSGSESWR
jgi:integrase